MTTPDALSLATLSDPYPAYAELRRGPPLQRDEELGGWRAVSAAAVQAALTSEVCAVRPPGQPLPAHLGGAAARLFGGLVRMQDGDRQRELKAQVRAELGGLAAEVAGEARRWAEVLFAAPTPGQLTEPALALPVYVLGRLLGCAEAGLPRLAGLVHDFAPAMTAAPTPEQLVRAERAAGALLALFGARGGPPAQVINRVGLLWQAYEATAGLLLNSLLALARQPTRAAPESLGALVREVAVLDPSIQNTRRFVQRDGELLGQRVRAGEPVLVLLASANHDPAGPPASFGAGAHACPGAEIACAVAEAGVAACLKAGLDLRQLPARPRYRPSPNVRIPEL